MHGIIYTAPSCSGPQNANEWMDEKNLVVVVVVVVEEEKRLQLDLGTLMRIGAIRKHAFACWIFMWISTLFIYHDYCSTQYGITRYK